MKSSLLATALIVGLSSGAFAQAAKDDHQQHHPGGGAAQAQPAPAPSPPAQPPATTTPGQAAQHMPQQCHSMMTSMQSCMGMMQQMMHGRMGGSGGGQMGMGGGQGGMMGGMMGGMAQQQHAAGAAGQSEASKAYAAAAERMHGPMMEGVAASDPDAAFVRGMIPHHQAAIDMAKVVLQFGKDEQVKKLAEAVVREQQREIGEMQEWLKKNAR
jgi:uncharacterized protein (DUF305 family)